MNQNSGTAQAMLGQMGVLLDEQWKIQAEELKNQREEMRKLKEVFSKIWDLLREEHSEYKEKIQKLEEDVSELREKHQAEQLRAKSLTERVTRQAEQISSLESEKETLSKQHEKVMQKQAEDLQRKIDAVRDALDGLRQELGSDYSNYESLYRRFKESPWAREDTAMRRLYGEDYVVFFARCGSEQIVKQFHDDLHAVILEETDEYRELADKLLDFCAAACERLHPLSTYTRQEDQSGSDYNYRRHKQCGAGDGKIGRVLLHGIEKDGQTLLPSYVEREA